MILIFAFTAIPQIPDSTLRYDKCTAVFRGDSSYTIVGRRVKVRDGRVVVKQDSSTWRCRNNRMTSITKTRVDRVENEVIVSDTTE